MKINQYGKRIVVLIDLFEEVLSRSFSDKGYNECLSFIREKTNNVHLNLRYSISFVKHGKNEAFINPIYYRPSANDDCIVQYRYVQEL